ncbi:MAG TPA: hypothetical protein VMX54_10070 [Vicinamibacteria bacterium]|nr:hypothetical protein [Vicinamibacteria bacterium]
MSQTVLIAGVVVLLLVVLSAVVLLALRRDAAVRWVLSLFRRPPREPRRPGPDHYYKPYWS